MVPVLSNLLPDVRFKESHSCHSLSCSQCICACMCAHVHKHAWHAHIKSNEECASTGLWRWCHLENTEWQCQPNKPDKGRNRKITFFTDVRSGKKKKKKINMLLLMALVTHVASTVIHQTSESWKKVRGQHSHGWPWPQLVLFWVRYGCQERRHRTT